MSYIKVSVCPKVAIIESTEIQKIYKHSFLHLTSMVSLHTDQSAQLMMP